jgi:hypothetical protein
MLGSLGKKSADACLGIECRLCGLIGDQFNGAN